MSKLRLPYEVKNEIERDYRLMESNVDECYRTATSYQIIKARILKKHGLDPKKYKWVN